MPGRSLSMATVLVCVASTATAQRWEGGIKSGISHAGLTPTDEFVWKNAPTTAAFAWRHLNRFVSIQPELGYLRRSGVSSITGSTVTMTTDNFELPVMLRFHLPEARDGGIAPYVSAGPNIGVRVRCRVQFLGGGVTTDDPCESGGARSRRVDLGVTGGAGVDWYLGSVSLVTEARASAGLRPYVVPTDASEAKSVSLSFVAGISMPLRFGDDPRPVATPPARPRVLAERGGPTVVPVSSQPRDVTPTGTSEPAPVPPAQSGAGGPRRITLTVDNADIHDLASYVLKTTGYKIELPQDVHARVSGTLRDMTGEEVAQAIAEVSGLLLIRPSTSEEPARLVHKSGQPLANDDKAATRSAAPASGKPTKP